MRTKLISLTVASLVVVTLQSTVANYIRVYGVKPNLPLVLTICVSFLGGSLEGAAVGLFTGFCQDIISGRLLGFYAMLGMYTGLVSGFVNRRLFRENLLIVIIFSYVISSVYEILVYLLHKWGWYLAGIYTKIELLTAVKEVILPEAIYNCIAVIPVFLIIYRLYHIFDDKKVSKRLL